MRRKKVEKQNQNSKKLLEDINRITNEDNYDHQYHPVGLVAKRLESI